MAGIYIHIPFCKRACHYCDFHFSTTFKKRDQLVQALIKEITLRKGELAGTEVQTIYFGGGTPSVLENEQIAAILETVYDTFMVSNNPEITLEANPDDLSGSRLMQLSTTKINRLSIGVQSFYDQDLKWMNRTHSGSQAKQVLQEAITFFPNLTADLIYGIPASTHKHWLSNIQELVSIGVVHVSAYALTVEPRTSLERMIHKGSAVAPDEAHTREQFELLTAALTSNGYVHYELSNFGKPGAFSRHNMGYWKGAPYLGIGPSAHSFNAKQRSWNVANNAIYIMQINKGKIPLEIEHLSDVDRYNELIMTGLRTMWGVSLQQIEKDFEPQFLQYMFAAAARYIDLGLLEVANGALRATPSGKFLADGISSDLFMVG